MLFEHLYTDILLYLLQYLNDQDKIKITSLSKRLNQLKKSVKFTDCHSYFKIHKLSYYENFKKISYATYNTNIPPGITHLTFSTDFNNDINDSIPSSVTHLTFGFYFNQNIKGSIPNNVTHLKFGWCFNQNIEGCIPNSVTHLTIGYNLSKIIDGCIPKSVIYLHIYYCFKLPTVAEQFILREHFHEDISDHILENVNELTISRKCYEKNKNNISKRIKLNIL